MKKIILAISIALLTGCIALLIGCIQKQEIKQITELPIVTPTPTPILITLNPTPTPMTEYERFKSWLKSDPTNLHPYYFLDRNSHKYVIDGGNMNQWIELLRLAQLYGLDYENSYVCTHFSRDLIINASKAGYQMYAVKLTGYTRGDSIAWHAITLIKLDGKWYFVEPQNDDIIPLNKAYEVYGYEYAYIAKRWHIGRNNADLEEHIRYLNGLLDGQDWIWLKKEWT